jgi:adenylate cyclase
MNVVDGIERTFVFADLAGYTALTEAHGDTDAAEIAMAFHALAATCVGLDGHIVRTIGDGVMIVSHSVEAGIAAASNIAAAVMRERRFPAVRIGIHTGTAAMRGNDYFGAAVNLAARVCTVARGGEIVATEPVAEVAVARGLASARPMGTVRLKNVLVPVALYELGTASTSASLFHVDPVCRMQVSPDEATETVVVDGATIYFCSKSCAGRFAESPDVYLAGLSDRV